MCPLPNTTRPNSFSEASSEAGDITAAFTGKDYYQELINIANTVPIAKLFKHYNIRIDSYNRKTTCPFKSHKGGRESTPSFWYYPDTNSYHCFGCRQGNRPVDLVAEIERCTKVQAAHKVMELFEADVDEDNVYDRKSASERMEILMELSNAVREFCATFPGEKALVYVEGACSTFDDMHLEKLFDNNEALRRAVEFTKDYLGNYKP